jgi:aspartyl-tRNA(Asn)/glutamyl-tRNA(Gln) amidotransferase subunit A
VITDDIRSRDREINALVEYAQNSNNHGHLQAKMAESPLADWTFAIKANIAVKGFAHTAGIGAYRNRIASHDAFVVDCLRNAGAEIAGSANMEEAALGAVTNNPHFGKTHNPRRHGFTPGGSSGGSAAAVAAGLVRAALGTDTMGSCRIPAAYCGVVGFKPSFGRLSCRGVEPLSRRLDHVGILATSVADVTAAFAVLDRFDALDANAFSYAEIASPQRQRPTLTVLDAAATSGLTEPVRAAYASALTSLEAGGYTLVASHIDQTSLARARRAGLLLCEAELANTLSAPLSVMDGGVSPQLRAMIAFGANQSAPKLAAAHAVIDETELALREQLDGVDAICWPTSPQTAFSFDDAVPANQADFTCLANFTGAPAISLPLPVADGALPVGMQLMMARGRDRALLQLASQIESQLNSATDVSHRRTT